MSYDSYDIKLIIKGRSNKQVESIWPDFNNILSSTTVSAR